MHIFLANNTQQNRHFLYRVPERPTVRQAVMRPGAQVKLADDLDDVGLRFVVEQLTTAGAVPHDDPRAIQSPFSVLYRVGKAIGAEEIDIALERETEVRQDVSEEMVEQTGLTAFATAGAGKDTVQSTSLEIVQLEDISDRPEKDGVNVEIRVDRKASPGKVQRGKRNGAGK